MRQLERLTLLSTLTAIVLSLSASAADWTNSGGNAGRNCRSTEVGPNMPAVIWSMSRPSIIAWQPVTEGNRVYMVRQTGFPPSGEPNGSPVVCQDLTTGVELWFAHVPFNTGDWTTWVAGVSNGRVYASRSGNGASVMAKLHCFDAATGAPLWMSVDPIDAGAYDGVVFAPNGDPIIGSFQKIWRIDHLTGATAWVTDRGASVSGNCGVAVHGDAVYAADAAPGGNVIKRFDLATGMFQYQTPVMPGFLTQQTPMVGPDGTVYLSRVQNNAAVDFFYAWTDTGTAFSPKWNVPAGYSAGAEFGVGPDGSVYHLAPGNEIHRLDPVTGMTLNTSGPIAADFMTPRFAIDAQGRVYFTNGAFSNGVLISFDADLAVRWSVSVPNANIGGPVLGQNGTLVMAGIGTNVTAYRDSTVTTAYCPGDGSGLVACPCGNFGAPGHGCASSVDPAGGRLQASGLASVSADSVVLSGSGMPNAAVLYFQGTSQQGGGAGTVFGDGLRCAGGTIARLGTKLNAGGMSHYPEPGDVPISVRGQIPPAGGGRTYQAWYRNAAAFCTPSTFNLTNGVEFAWVP